MDSGILARKNVLIHRLLRSRNSKVIYHTGKRKCLRFPELVMSSQGAGTSRNFQVFEPLEFLAGVGHLEHDGPRIADGQGQKRNKG